MTSSTNLEYLPTVKNIFLFYYTYTYLGTHFTTNSYIAKYISMLFTEIVTLSLLYDTFIWCKLGVIFVMCISSLPPRLKI